MQKLAEQIMSLSSRPILDEAHQQASSLRHQNDLVKTLMASVARKIGGDSGFLTNRDIQEIRNQLQRENMGPKSREEIWQDWYGKDTDIIDDPEAMGKGGGYSYRGQDPFADPRDPILVDAARELLKGSMFDLQSRLIGADVESLGITPEVWVDW